MSRARALPLLFLSASLGVSQGPPPARAATVEIEVDFAAATPRKSMTGFLHGYTVGGPPDAVIEPLKPGWWRISAVGDLSLYQRAAAFGAQVQVLVSDTYGYPLNNWNGNGAPYDNWERWEAHVRAVANVYRGQPVHFDIWNEPDVADWNKTLFWDGTATQHHETYARAYRVLREELGPNVPIGGPSLANYDEAAIKAFLDYCKKNRLEVNFLSWHELYAGDDDTPAVADHIQALLKLKKKYRKQRISQILVNEYGGPASQYLPGHILAFLYYLEEGGADGAIKACWDDSKAINNCWNESLDGILDAKKKPRAAWWTYKTYADGIDSRVKATSSAPGSVVALASGEPAQVLIGTFGQDAAATTTIDLTLEHLDAAGFEGAEITVRVLRIPALAEKKVKRLKALTTRTEPLVDGAASLTLPALKRNEQFVVEISD